MLHYKTEVQPVRYNQAHLKQIHFRMPPPTEWADSTHLIDFLPGSVWAPPKDFKMRGDP